MDDYEKLLKSEGLFPIDYTYMDTTYIESERIGGQRTLLLGVDDIPDDELSCLAVYDEHDTPFDEAQTKALALVEALPKPIRVLGEKKLKQGGLSRSDAQTLRRLLSYFTWKKCKEKALTTLSKEE